MGCYYPILVFYLLLAELCTMVRLNDVKLVNGLELEKAEMWLCEKWSIASAD